MVNNGTKQTPEQNSLNCGSIDESERAFGETERAIAEFLEREGKNVKALVEKTDGGRNPDAEVDGKFTEFKSLDAGATSATVKNQINNSIRRGGQARDIIIDARVSGLIEAEAERGLQRAKNITRGKIDSVRIIGDIYDITFTEFQ
ncbi:MULTISPECIES: CdiA C-terminal domain-containing protein [unclassified Microcoleus]|uniref:CdiA C-terminal domain-containing protein n=1 Tax=unclassified Microcoleus TaxID=2642155 RepID=UPI002FD018D4